LSLSLYLSLSLSLSLSISLSLCLSNFITDSQYREAADGGDALMTWSCLPTCLPIYLPEFFNHTWWSRHNQSMPDHSLTFLWSLSVSIKDFGALLGSLGVKCLADSFGRRNSILIVNALSVVGACLMFASKANESFEMLIVGRLVFGLFCGLVMSLNPLYIQEVSPTNLRGAFATLNQVSFATGILLGMVRIDAVCLRLK
uniref:Major facilitator superfamily (MFS) profile domain-containing protein n=1 Tax=Hucho hucho TaxID=62062 RepID=A0A4W5RWP7_9TELE